MRSDLPEKVEMGRVLFGVYGSLKKDGPMGAFRIIGPSGAVLNVLSSGSTDEPAGENWEHVSVSVEGNKRCPNWQEMCAVKDWFWNDDETVIQFHPDKKSYVNCHPHTLHLWKHRFNQFAPLPNPWLVGPLNEEVD